MQNAPQFIDIPPLRLFYLEKKENFQKVLQISLKSFTNSCRKSYIRGGSSDIASSYFPVQVKSRSMLHRGSVGVSSE